MIKKRPDRLKNRTGEIRYNKSGSKMKIIEYIEAMNITIEFDNGYIVKNNYQNFKKGLIKNPYDKTIYGVGYIGIENYNDLQNISYEKAYSVWKDMLYRCYDLKHQLKKPLYAECNVCQEWHNYSVFKKWFDKNYYELPGGNIHLDKDILIQGNKLYSPDTCIFVPQVINQIFQTHEKRIKDLPTGVRFHGKKYIASISNNLLKQRIYSKSFEFLEDAQKEYIILKRQYILDIAEHYKKFIPILLYHRLLKYGKEYGNV